MLNTPRFPVQSEHRLLARLPRVVFERLAPLLQAVALPAKLVLYKVRAPLDCVHFPTSGIISAMTVMENGSAIEVATIGNEGMSGLTAFVGGESSPYEVMVQVPGDGLRMKANDFQPEVGREGPLRDLLVRYYTAFSTQVSYAVACNGLHTVEKRCCRWLLMTQDRVGADLLPLTHEFLAIMLGVRRASVTEVLRPLQEQGIIHNGRGEITILDRAALKANPCECYRVVEEEFARLFDETPRD
jgi:CRP-like cAMP-binding protein